MEWFSDFFPSVYVVLCMLNCTALELTKLFLLWIPADAYDNSYNDMRVSSWFHFEDGEVVCIRGGEAEFMAQCRIYAESGHPLQLAPPAPRRTFDRFWEIRSKSDKTCNTAEVGHPHLLYHMSCDRKSPCFGVGFSILVLAT